MTEIDIKEIAKKWQEKWNETQIYKTTEGGNKPKYYILDMFPYPSGVGLHVGHPRGFVATDTTARMKILQGYNVLHPMGWDAFGLPAEQFALKNNLHPKESTDKNIDTFKKQLALFGFTYDRDREINTTDPGFYKWTQRTFLQFYNHYFDEEEQKAKPIAELREKIENGKLKIENGSLEDYLDSQRLVYIDYKPIIWCPSCKTGLANEDLEDGKCERCDSNIEMKPMKQWILRITKYAERMLAGLDELPEWVSHIKELQRNWIGKSIGTKFDMKIDGMEEGFSVFTTRIDTVFGMSFVVISPEHPLVAKITSDQYKDQVKNYQEQAKKKTELQRTDLEKDKTGVFSGAYAINPFNNQKVPIYVGDYVLMDYGTGVVMAVPAHDERDYEFAKKYDIEILQSIAPYFKTIKGDDAIRDDAETVRRKTIYAIVKHPNEDKYIGLDWGRFGWKSTIIGGVDQGEDIVEAAHREVSEETGYKNIKHIQTVSFEGHSHYFASHKGVNRYQEAWGVVFQLENLEQEEISDYDKKVHKMQWVDAKNMGGFINLEINKFFWDMYYDGEKAYTEYGILVNSGEFTGLSSKEAIAKMNEWLESKGIGKATVQYKIQDWTFSRQRYWGEPFPIVHCENCGIVPLEEKDLPVLLPNVEAYEPTGTEEGPLANIKDWIEVDCPKCGGPAKRESNTMPQWAGSSWYFIRYKDPKNNEVLVDPEIEKYWNIVDFYVGGGEHATRHLIYARFWHKFLYDLGIVSTNEPFKRLQNVGMVLAEDGRKMSKRWGNVINPDDVIAEFGPDTFRVYSMFMGPFDHEIAWSTKGLKGAHKFLKKVIALLDKVEGGAEEPDEVVSELHKTIKKVSEDIEEFKFNTAIAQMMILVNKWTEQDKINKENFENFIVLLSCFTPHICEELRERLGNEYSIFSKAKWPEYEDKFLQTDTVDLAVQFNGKTRGTLNVDKEIEEEKLIEILKSDKHFGKYFVGEIKKVIYVKGKIVNFIV